MKPTPLTLSLALLACRPAVDRWCYADEVRGRLKALFGHDASAQQVAAWLGPMCRVNAPWAERDRDYNGCWRYRLTRYGRNDIENRLGVRVVR